MLTKLLEQRSDLSRKDIEERIQQKKAKIGEGYLTDQGALHLVASDLELTISEPIKTEMGLKDLYVGVPVIIGSGGIEQVVELDLDAEEKKHFDTSIEAVNELFDAAKNIDPSLK